MIKVIAFRAGESPKKVIQDKINKIINAELSQIAENNFVEEVYKNEMDVLEILNWYRNLYYKEGNNTERGVMAEAINQLFPQYKNELNI